MSRARACLLLSLGLLGAGCAGGPQAAPRAATSPSMTASSSPSGKATGGWHLTVYYTPVESYHGPPTTSITDCGGGDLGRHSSDFLERVKTEGFGRMSAPVRTASYLGWNFDSHCWFLAGSPVGATDRPLRAWGSVAAPATVALGASVRVDSCGADVAGDVCVRVRGAAWVVDDRFSADSGEPRHLDLYVGEEDRAGFESQSPYYFEAHQATVRVLG